MQSKENKTIGIDIPKGFSFHRIDTEHNKIICIKNEPVFPTTFEECCRVLKISTRINLVFENRDVEIGNHYLVDEKEFLNDFIRLRLCYKAYMKLINNLAPDLKDTTTTYYAIKTHFGEITLTQTNNLTDGLLVFPTIEIRDMFYNNFKSLIINCKSIL